LVIDFRTPLLFAFFISFLPLFWWAREGKLSSVTASGTSYQSSDQLNCDGETGTSLVLHMIVTPVESSDKMDSKPEASKKVPPDRMATSPNEKGDTIINIDGKLSVEHQLDIHVNDLLIAEFGKGPTVLDILTGIKYVMDYRIRNGRLPHLDYELCERLVQALLKFAPLRLQVGSTLFHHSKKLSKEAEMAFDLFRDFVEEVYEFRGAVGEIPLDELRRRLHFHTRLVHPQSTEAFEGAVSLLKTINRTYPQFDEWTDFIKEEDYHETEKVLQASDYFRDDASRKTSIKPIICFPPQTLYFDRDVSRVCDMFKTSVESGLDPAQVHVHRNEYGSNVLPAPQQKTALRMILDQLADFMIIVLICTMILSAIMDYPKITSAAVLAVVIVCNVFIGFWQEWKAAKTVKALKSLTVPRARVLRGGNEDMIDASDLVPGDVVLLSEGDYVPADLRLAKVSRLEIIEANLTGESDPVAKNTLPINVKSRKIPVSRCQSNAFMSTLVARGSGLGVVVRVGEYTEIGKINAALAEQAALPAAEAKSPLQRKLSRLGLILVIVAVGLSLVVAIAGILWGRSFKDMLPVAIRY
jgi:Ca2+-transporting ATPase